MKRIEQIRSFVFSQVRYGYACQQWRVLVDLERRFALTLIEEISFEFLSILHRRRLILAGAILVVRAGRRGENRLVLQNPRQIVVAQQPVVHSIGVVFALDFTETATAQQTLRFSIPCASVIDLQLRTITRESRVTADLSRARSGRYLKVGLDDFREQRILLLLDEKLIEQFERCIAQLDPVASVVPKGFDVFALSDLFFREQGFNTVEIVGVSSEHGGLQVRVRDVGAKEGLRLVGVIFFDQIEVHVHEERIDQLGELVPARRRLLVHVGNVTVERREVRFAERRDRR